MKYLSLFSGIAGFEKGIEDAGLDWECVGYSEIDKYARAIYSYHYPNHKDYGDATEIDVSRLPDFDLLVGGFPCQAFSIAGKQRGFDDIRGTLFFEIARILRARKPRWFLLENVKNILSHDDHRTISTIYEILTELGYTVGWQVVNSCKFGVPQNRERAFFVGNLGEATERIGKILPVGSKNKGPDEGTKQPAIARTFTAGGNSGGLHSSMTLIKPGTWRTHKDGQGFREVESGIAPTIPARAREDGSGQPVVKTVGAGIRRLTPTECERLQGFPDDWTKYGLIANEKVEISDTQRYKSLGNAVTVSVIEKIATEIDNTLIESAG